MDLTGRILYEDDAILVLDKPAGIAVESARVTDPDLRSMLRAYLNGAEIYIVHRLDQVVSGVVLFAKTQEAAADLSKQLTDGAMKKIYRARVAGTIPKDADELEDYLLKDPKTNTSRVVSEKAASGKGQSDLPKAAYGKGRQQVARNVSGGKGPRPKRAVLRYKKIGEDTLEIELLTGRHHQIRAQLSHAGMPIRGDRKYGAPEDPSLPRGEIALCAQSLSFMHPKSQKVMQIYSEYGKLDSNLVS